MNRYIKRIGILGLSALMAIVMAAPVFADDSSSSQPNSTQNESAYWTDFDIPKSSVKQPVIDQVDTDLGVIQHHACGLGTNKDKDDVGVESLLIY